MNIEEVREYCLMLPGATEDMPYGPDCVTFRIEGKIFLHLFLDRHVIAIKLLPERGEELRDKYEAITPAWHLNKRHWNDIVIENTLSNQMIGRLISESYSLVLSKLPKALKCKYITE